MGTTTSPDNLWSTTDADPLQLDAITATMQSSVQVALNNRAILSYRWADATARANQSGMTAGDEGYQIDTDTRYYYNGTTWVELADNYKIYATEATLLLTTEPAGVLAYAQDTGITYRSTGADWVAVVSFAIKRAGATTQSIPNSTVTGVVLRGTVEAQGDLDTSVNDVITVTVPGLYECMGWVRYQNPSATGSKVAYLTVNGVAVTQQDVSGDTQANLTVKQFRLSPGDTVGLQTSQSSGTAQLINHASALAAEAWLKVERKAYGL